jgi:hypothetical protein
MQRVSEFRIRLWFDKRPDGRFHIHSPNVPGLHLAGRDLRALCNDIDPAVKDLLRDNLKIEAEEIRWVPSLEDIREHFSAPAEGENVFVVKYRDVA